MGVGSQFLSHFFPSFFLSSHFLSLLFSAFLFLLTLSPSLTIFLWFFYFSFSFSLSPSLAFSRSLSLSPSACKETSMDDGLFSQGPIETFCSFCLFVPSLVRKGWERLSMYESSCRRAACRPACFPPAHSFEHGPACPRVSYLSIAIDSINKSFSGLPACLSACPSARSSVSELVKLHSRSSSFRRAHPSTRRFPSAEELI